MLQRPRGHSGHGIRNRRGGVSCTHMRIRFHHAGTAIAAVLVVHAAALAGHWYGAFPPLDVPMHFFGGFVMGMLAIALQHEFLQVHRLPKAAWWHELLFVLGFVGLVAIGWEFFEFGVDALWSLRDAIGVSQVSMADTMADLAVGLLGGLVAHALFRPGRR
jgi:hypothetical protein